MDNTNLLWNLYVELRKELIESQKLRAQIIGFKITFVSAAIGIIGTNLEKIPSILLVILAFAAIFFDFLINSNSFAIKHIGFYIRHHLEPMLINTHNLSDTFILWEKFLYINKTHRSLAFMGNLGITTLAIGAATIALLIPFRPVISIILLILLVIFLIIDIWSFSLPAKFHEDDYGKRKSNS